MRGRGRARRREDNDLRFLLMNGGRSGNPSIGVQRGNPSIGARRGNPSIRACRARLIGKPFVASHELDLNKSFNQRIHQDQPKTLQEPVEKKKKVEMNEEKYPPACQEEMKDSMDKSLKEFKRLTSRRLATQSAGAISSDTPLGSPPGSSPASPPGSIASTLLDSPPGSPTGSIECILLDSPSGNRSRNHSESRSASSGSGSGSGSRSGSRSGSHSGSRSSSHSGSRSGSPSSDHSGSHSGSPTVTSPPAREDELNDQLSKVKDKLIQELKDSLDKTKTDAMDAKIETDVLRRILYSKESEKTRARTLEQEKNRLLLTVSAFEESNSKMKIEIVKMKENFEQTQKTLEDNNSASKSRNVLEDSAAKKLKKLRHLMTAKVYLLDPSNEDLETLQTIEIEKLFLKYEKGTMVKDSFKEKYEETRETLADVKTKLQLKSDKNISLEKKLIEIMDILNISGESRSFDYILPAIQNLKKYLGSEQEETEHYTNATALIHSTTNTD